MKPNGLTISVGYGDLLAVTLPRNARHFKKIVVGTTHADKETQAIIATIPNVECFLSNAFYDDGARFNKGKVVESCLDHMGRAGWICIFDADIIMPDTINLDNITPDHLHVPRRRILADPRQWTPELDWTTCPVKKEEGEWPGYFQLFHADDPLLKDRRPWYGINWVHGGGCDSDFMRIWPGEKKTRLPFEVLHLGEDGKNWNGRATIRMDGTMPENAEANATQQERMLARRRRPGKRYAGEKIE